MWPLGKPSHTPRDTYRTCISRSRDPLLKARLESLETVVVLAAERYEQSAAAATLHTLSSTDFGPTKGEPTAAEDLTKVYTNSMASRGAPGRRVYDELKLAARRCPLCGHGTVTTLDHHLPKSAYPYLAVIPSNLVPACSDCNKTKTSAAPATAEEQTLHPYFDDIDQETWLSAEVLEEGLAALRFCVRPSGEWSTCLAARVRHHFNTFRLDRLYAAQASDELAGLAYVLQQLFDVAGAEGVRDYAKERALSESAVRRNHWKTATYWALANSSWYCSGGFAAL
ncbi:MULTISPECIES: hypothetical protein [unclassified Streptomyces]|uniref:HNH endonuclease n=1 Tax=unclassified Streptomyces TaxID=2593676 RepID=UPI002DD9D84E|nr:MULTISPECIES: hypothetical protein [unclassified Streptomyces]WSA91660.1 hypothetical protein OIE63_08865 [Streptomyces sp. NBC_01795]WSB76032.1 hypothetical protein OHB04_09670 [Streptomyces sp. NBC_01775]WSS15694.1 hypothetical protein OG533_30260 [Streptomyces sp. NBC_01186]WSS44535.1 hypothetical protein OG220_31055 [Streptomyces sp. NBC_01187]